MTGSGVANGVILGDDDLLVRGIIGSMLRAAGHNVFLASDGDEAVNLARQFRPRLVLLDINMPRLNGLLATKAIRAMPANAGVPIIILTAYTDARMRCAAEELRVSGYITKPFRPDELLRKLSPYLDGMPGAKTEPRAPPVQGVVWKPRGDPGQVSGTDRGALVGREVLRIVRKAEGNDPAG
jgi:two-component system chemotaxis response regulator CheY